MIQFIISILLKGLYIILSIFVLSSLWYYFSSLYSDEVSNSGILYRQSCTFPVYRQSCAFPVLMLLASYFSLLNTIVRMTKKLFQSLYMKIRIFTTSDLFLTLLEPRSLWYVFFYLHHCFCKLDVRWYRFESSILICIII